MTEATINKWCSPTPNMEVFQVTVSDGETIVSRKFKQVDAVIASFNMTNGQYTDETISCSFSDATVTCELAGVDTSDVSATVMIFGHAYRAD